METITIMIMNVEKAARAERAAEQNRAKAETVWRQAWWATTLALAEPPHSNKKAIGEAFSAAELILGQTRDYISKRRATGQVFAAFEGVEISTLPPRLSIAYAQAQGDPARAITVLKSAEARELSLRDFAAELGRQPQSWLREGERPEVPEQVRNMTVEQRAELTRELLSDPETVDAALNRPDIHAPGSPTVRIYGNITRARAEAEKQRAADRQEWLEQNPDLDEANKRTGQAGAMLDLSSAVSRYTGETRRFASDVAALLPQVTPYSGAAHAMSFGAAVADANEGHDQAGSTLAALVTYIRGGSSLDNELAKILGGDTRGER
jgi:hypothetical protein